MNILALDQATKTGWCAGQNLWGLWDLNIKKDEDNGMRLIRLRSKLIEMIDEHKIDLIVYEAVFSRFQQQAVFAAKLVAVIEMVCNEKGISHSSISASEIKKSGAGHGKASKGEMITAAEEKYGYEGNNDNVADAIHLYFLAKERFK